MATVRRLALLLLVAACSRKDDQPNQEHSAGSAAPSGADAPVTTTPAPELLHLPGADPALPPAIAGGLLPGAPRIPSSTSGRCPDEMVDVRGEFCIDRFEVHLVDARSGQELSPFYHPRRAVAQASFKRYGSDGRGRATIPELPMPAASQLEVEPEPVARSSAAVVPQGYLSGDLGATVCRAAGKRLCSLAEWTRACRGQQERKYPYGDRYVAGACNVFREAHPAAIVHGDPSREHLDPRLNLVATSEGPLLHRTGATPRCRSEWGADAVFDMVGNLDEWVAEGFFVGGFYSRGTREGCDARITSHPPEYFDYSLGTRCCRSLGL